MIYLVAVPGGKGCLYPKPGAEGQDVILEFDPKRPGSLQEEIYHIKLGHHRELGKGISRKRKWEMEQEVNINQAIMCLYNVRQDIIASADEGRQIDVEDRRWFSWPSFLSQVEEMTGVSQDYIQDYLAKESNQ